MLSIAILKIHVVELRNGGKVQKAMSLVCHNSATLIRPCVEKLRNGGKVLCIKIRCTRRFFCQPTQGE